MNKKIYIYLFLLIGFAGVVQAQNTVGVTTYDNAQTYPGYNLVFPHRQGTVWLLDNCGRIMNTWEDTTSLPGNIAYLKDNGNIVIGKRLSTSGNNDPIWAGGGGETVEERTWDDQLVWNYTWNNDKGRFHHDMALMPNGNVLQITWILVDSMTAIAAGRDPNLLPDGEVWPDAVVELEPDGQGGANIVWQWNAWDHLVQDFDTSKSNWGVVGDHPELINLNYDDGLGEADWHHMNAMDYNEDLDQIVLSVPSFNEIWIIDHSTSTQEAATHAGGNSGVGGDLLYRWGNPMAYDQGDSTDIQFWFEHDVHWINDFVDPGFEADYGKIMVFNNRRGADYSSVNIIAPSWDSASSSYLMTGSTYLPATYDWDYTTSPMQDMYSTGLSSAQRLPNGNTLMLVGRYGRAFEINDIGNIVWEYVVPINMGAAASQGDTLNINQNLTFRLKRYPVDYGAFTGRTMTANGYVEMNPDTSGCPLPLLDASAPIEDIVAIFPNPATDELFLDRMTGKSAELEIFDIVGNRLHASQISGLRSKITLDGFVPGVYFIRLDKKASGKFLVR